MLSHVCVWLWRSLLCTVWFLLTSLCAVFPRHSSTCSPQVFMNTATVTGNVELPEGTEMVMVGVLSHSASVVCSAPVFLFVHTLLFESCALSLTTTPPRPCSLLAHCTAW
jgi:hypothetical protein